ncbi:HD domain-containing protein [Saccharopolyspora taberi]|uniref:HDIG domain-containing protein n=1 Tax=Saccharopolyspora taberi TaxID=60895 RepID=A0ABN3VL37_9PSEU
MDLATWARELAREHLAAPLPRRWAHVQGVTAQAQRLAPLFGAEADVLTAAAALHDIGYAPALAETGFHPLDGARFLRAAGAPERLVHLVAHHSAAQIDAQLWGLATEFAEFEDERSPLRDALWWADMTVGPDGRVMTFPERMAEVRQRYGPDDPVTLALDLSMEARSAAVERTEARMRTGQL